MIERESIRCLFIPGDEDLGNEQQSLNPRVCVNKRDRTKQKNRASSP